MCTCLYTVEDSCKFIVMVVRLPKVLSKTKAKPETSKKILDLYPGIHTHRLFLHAVLEKFQMDKLYVVSSLSTFSFKYASANKSCVVPLSILLHWLIRYSAKNGILVETAEEYDEMCHEIDRKKWKELNVFIEENNMDGCKKPVKVHYIKICFIRYRYS